VELLVECGPSFRARAAALLQSSPSVNEQHDKY
jgi:hypothetical protein